MINWVFCKNCWKKWTFLQNKSSKQECRHSAKDFVKLLMTEKLLKILANSEFYVQFHSMLHSICITIFLSDSFLKFSAMRDRKRKKNVIWKIVREFKQAKLKFSRMRELCLIAAHQCVLFYSRKKNCMCKLHRYFVGGLLRLEKKFWVVFK